MPGWYIHMDVARKALDSLDANPRAAGIFGANGPSAADVTAIAHANPTYVALGAIGPDIFFLLPDFKPPVGNMLWKLATTIRDLYTAWDETFLGPYESAMGPIGDNAADEINALTGGLKDTIDEISSEAMKLLQDFIIKLILQQYDFFGLLSSGVPAGFDEQTFFWSDMLHYRETYRFGAELWQRASALDDEDARARFQAFALGWMTHLATDVTGHSFVNQKAGGPYRLHWQRHHLVENHMDALVYNSEHGSQAIYQQMANAALHLWLAFNPDGTSREDFFTPEPNPPYPDGDHSADIVGRHAVWDVDSDLPDDLAQFLSDALKAVFTPALSAGTNGMVACCPTIISTLDGRVPLETGGFAEKEDIVGAYWWLFKYVKWTTTDYYNIRRPEPPDVVVIPSFPQPPGSGDSDPGPGASSDDSLPEDVLSFLLMLLAWAFYLGEVLAWPVAAVAGIIAGTATYPLREALYEAIELPLYNLWLSIHTFLAMTGYVMPMPGEINAGLTTLGVTVGDDWTTTVAALGTFDGGLTPSALPTDPSQSTATGFPRDVVMDPPGAITSLINTIFEIGAPEVNGEDPSEFTRPWRWPGLDNEGDTINLEAPHSVAGPFALGQDATALFGAMPGSATARKDFEGAPDEATTIRLALTLLKKGEHLGDPVDYAAYVIARLTRDGLDPAKVANFNLDSDRGYAYLCWDWVRDPERRSMPKGFVGLGDPSHGGAPTNVSQHVYPSPAEPGYGWNPDEEFNHAGHPPPVSFDPNDPNAAVRIRYVDRQAKF
jgi:zinc dependent phospholipase C